LWNQDDLIAEREKYGANAIPVGLTGLAQVRGRDELPINTKAAYDGEYAQKMSFPLDIKILFLTVVNALTARGVSEGGPASGNAEGIQSEPHAIDCAQEEEQLHQHVVGEEA
jgi:O-antigen biosynthesis protein WbqP